MQNSLIFKSLILLLQIFRGIKFSSSQFNSPNNLCGGHFHYVKGSINFTFTEDALNPLYNGSKVCIWQISPSVQYTAFKARIVKWTLPSSNPTFTPLPTLLPPLPTLLPTIPPLIQPPDPCAQGSVSFTSFRDRDSKGMFNYGPFCSTQMNNLTIEGSVLIIILRVDMSSDLNRANLLITFDKADNATTDHRYRVTTMQNSFGKNIDPLPYYFSSIFRHEVATYAFPKWNGSDSTKISMDFFQLDFNSPGCENTEICDWADYFGIYSIERDGKLIELEILRKNKGTREPYESKYGLLLYWNAGNNSTAGSGGSFSMIYRTKWIRTEL